MTDTSIRTVSAHIHRSPTGPRQWQADLLCLQETHQWAKEWRWQVAGAEATTGLRLLWQTMNRSSTTLLYNPGPLRLNGWEDKYAG